MSVPGADARSTNEVFGYIVRLATLSAKHMTDYVLDMGTAVMFANGNLAVLEQAVAAGLLEYIEVDGARKVRLIDDPAFIHIRLKEDVEHDRQQNNDTRNPNLKGPVILRDGDTCRWCGKHVTWSGPHGKYKATIDHLEPGKPGTVDTMVVACMPCNSARQQDDMGTWSTYHQLLPAPAQPRYGKWSRRYLVERGFLREPAAPTPALISDEVSGSPSSGESPDQVLEIGGGRTSDADGAPASISREVICLPSHAGRDCDPPQSEVCATASGAVTPSRDDSGTAGPAHEDGGPGRCESGQSQGRVSPLVADSVMTQSRLSASASRDFPGREGTGGGGSGREGPGLDGTGRQGAPPGRRRKRRSNRGRSVP
ncbi:hypothetical protein I6B53_03340 [Schaalia sp. 19OD2882]|uniref:HNH endonuclease n=1 Tax=Schaalia sp. 19OD2882 TaxID=2794089 RepID=UPI001C1EEE93|nr:hypothetical protein [Schaalia sp. 19OD2882]QWW20145.1 hypothetical protein I6B53_03340 [Schaalia sp. 19OD2882]